MRTMKYCLMMAAMVLAVAGSAMGQNLASTQNPAPEQKQATRRQGRPAMRMFRALELTDDQKARIKEIFRRSRTDAAPYRQQLRPLRDRMRELLASSSFDEAAVRSIASQEAQISTELRVIRARTQSSLLAVLTPEQKAKLSEFRNNNRARRIGRIGHMGKMEWRRRG